MYILCCATAVVFNAVTMSSSFTLIHLDYISWLLLNKKYSWNCPQLTYMLAIVQNRYFCVFYFYSSGRLGRERNFYQGSMQPSKGRWGEEVNHRYCAGWRLLLFWETSFAQRQSSWFVSLALPVNHKPNSFISLLLEKNDSFLFFLFFFWVWHAPNLWVFHFLKPSRAGILSPFSSPLLSPPPSTSILDKIWPVDKL